MIHRFKHHRIAHGKLGARDKYSYMVTQMLQMHTQHWGLTRRHEPCPISGGLCLKFAFLARKSFNNVTNYRWTFLQQYDGNVWYFELYFVFSSLHCSLLFIWVYIRGCDVMTDCCPEWERTSCRDITDFFFVFIRQNSISSGICDDERSFSEEDQVHPTISTPLKAIPLHVMSFEN